MFEASQTPRHDMRSCKSCFCLRKQRELWDVSDIPVLSYLDSVCESSLLCQSWFVRFSVGEFASIKSGQDTLFLHEYNMFYMKVLTIIFSVLCIYIFPIKIFCSFVLTSMFHVQDFFKCLARLGCSNILWTATLKSLLEALSPWVRLPAGGESGRASHSFCWGHS